MKPEKSATLQADGFVKGLDAALDAVEALEAMLATSPEAAETLHVYGTAYLQGFAQGFAHHLKKRVKERRSIEIECAKADEPILDRVTSGESFWDP
jgi:hypothetical protein